MARAHRAPGLVVLLASLAVAALAAPASALLEPRPQLQWRAGVMWGLQEANTIGLDWGVGVKVPLQPSELGVASLAASLQGTLSPNAEWDFRLGGLVDSYRTGRPTLGVYYTLRRSPVDSGHAGALNGIALRYGSFVAALYPAMWNPDLASTSSVLVVEPGWFSGLYVQLRYAARLGGTGDATSLRLAVGLEENW